MAGLRKKSRKNFRPSKNYLELLNCYVKLSKENLNYYQFKNKLSRTKKKFDKKSKIQPFDLR